MAATRKPHERAIIYAAVMGEMTREETNALLAAANVREIPESSFKMVKRLCVPAFRAEPGRLARNIAKPETASQLRMLGGAGQEPDGDLGDLD